MNLTATVIAASALSVCAAAAPVTPGKAPPQSQPVADSKPAAPFDYRELLGLSADGENIGPFSGRSELVGCRAEGEAALRKLDGGGYALTRAWADDQGHRCRVTDTFMPTKDSIRWEIEVAGEGEPWSAPIVASIRYPAQTNTVFWTAWDAPPQGDLLTPAPLSAARRYSYGAPRFTIEKPAIPWYNCAQRPDGEHYISLPIVTLFDPKASGLSFAASPEPMQLDMEMTVDKAGLASFTWYRHRISKATPVRLAVDIVKHEADWRGGLRWMTQRYPQYFNPPNPAMDGVAGCGNYAQAVTNLDLPALRKMNFTVNWNAEFDWPYLGMYLPPVGTNTTWQSWRGRQTSIAKMEAYARWMREQGLHVLHYFNVTEFGARTVFPPKVSPRTDPDWNDANAFLFNRLGPAILRVPENLNLPAKIKWPDPMWGKTRVGGLYYTWQEGVAMDCGEPVFRDFLLDQARRHVKEIPSTSGLAIDRLDWLRLYNLDRDDGVSWFDGKPARSLIWSWRTLLEELGPIMHEGGKVIYANVLVKRLDLMRHVDGIFDEIPGYDGDAILGLRRPVLTFNGPANDAFLQRCLYLGIHPMCPLPGNDHGLGWKNEQIRRPYLDYGPLLACLRGKKWVLEPHCVETATPGAKVNLFAVPAGYVLPVVFGGKATTATVRVRSIPGLDRLKCEALHPGKETALPVPSHVNDGVLELTVPLARGCAMVRLQREAP